MGKEWMDMLLPPHAVGSSVGSGYLSSVAARSQGRAVQSASRFNARTIRSQASQQAGRMRTAARQEIGAQRAAFGASGLQMAGSPLDLVVSNAMELERRAVETQLAGEQEANIEITRGKTAREQARRISASSLLQGGVQGLYYGRTLA